MIESPSSPLPQPLFAILRSLTRGLTRSSRVPSASLSWCLRSAANPLSGKGGTVPLNCVSKKPLHVHLRCSAALHGWRRSNRIQLRGGMANALATAALVAVAFSATTVNADSLNFVTIGDWGKPGSDQTGTPARQQRSRSSPPRCLRPPCAPWSGRSAAPFPKFQHLLSS